MNRKSPIIYEITANVREDLIATFERYMNEQHIPDVMATGAFESSMFTRSQTGRYRISYLTDRVSLDGYLRDHAPRLRAHVVESFPDGIDLSREEWEMMGEFKK